MRAIDRQPPHQVESQVFWANNGFTWLDLVDLDTAKKVFTRYTVVQTEIGVQTEEGKVIPDVLKS